MKRLECSSKGDTRFSPFFANVTVFGVTQNIETHYQTAKRVGDYVPKTWRDGKGKIPTHMHLNGHDYENKYLVAFYKLLWCRYLDQHPELVEYASQFDKFTDRFKGNAVVCQADVIRQYVKDGRQSIIDECQEFIDLLNENKRKGRL